MELKGILELDLVICGEIEFNCKFDVDEGKLLSEE